MRIEKLPSGSYRIRQQYKGKRYQLVLDYKPTQKEALELMTKLMNQGEEQHEKHAAKTFHTAYLDYISLKSNILSPSTKRGYKGLINAVPAWLKDKHISEIDSVDIQKFINDYSSDHSPKSCKNMYGFISIIMKTYRPNLVMKVQLPQMIKKEPYIPTADDVKRIMQEIQGTEYYVPTALAALGMRKSEICALTPEDISDDNCVTINKALVANENNQYVIKETTKTTESTRSIYIPDDVADTIRRQGYVYKGFPDNITRNLKRVQDRLGIEHFPLHKMRHFFASYAHNELKLSDKQIMDAGGWKSSAVLDTVYKHAMKQEEAKKQIATSMSGLF